jgi:hypothetical protein
MKVENVPSIKSSSPTISYGRGFYRGETWTLFTQVLIRGILRSSLLLYYVPNAEFA